MEEINDQHSNDIPSNITRVFSGSTVFLTGATGFLGRLFMEKLLRACPDLKRIYITIRSKKGEDMEQRFKAIFEASCFDVLMEQQPNFINKITWVPGDFNLPVMGLAETDRATLIKEVDYVIHCAATVRFDQKLATAIRINVVATRDLIEMAKQMKNLKGILHVSTAYMHCFSKNVDEVFYESPMDASKLISLTSILDNEKLDEITPILLGPYPNTYIYTKAVAESIVQDEAKGLPIAVFRPSMVTSTAKEPVAGWINNYYGPTGVAISISAGIMKSLHCNPDYGAEIVPADYAVNCALAVISELAAQKLMRNSNEIEREEESCQCNSIPIYNFVSTPERRVTWGYYLALTRKHGAQVPPLAQIWHWNFAFRSNIWAHRFACFFYQTIPGHIIDFIATCLGKEPIMMKTYQKIDKFSEVISYFATRESIYDNRNVQKLWTKMNPRDKVLFRFSMKDFNWDDYFYDYVLGIRVLLFKDPVDTIPQAKIRHLKLKVAHYFVVTVLGLVALKLFLVLLGLFF